MTWFAQGLRHPKLREFRMWERTLKERWADIRAEQAD